MKRSYSWVFVTVFLLWTIVEHYLSFSLIIILKNNNNWYYYIYIVRILSVYEVKYMRAYINCIVCNEWSFWRMKDTITGIRRVEDWNNLVYKFPIIFLNKFYKLILLSLSALSIIKVFKSYQLPTTENCLVWITLLMPLTFYKAFII